MCNEEIIKHMKEDMTFRGLSETTQKSYIWRVSRYMKFHEGKDIEKLTDDDIRDFLKYLVYIPQIHLRFLAVPLSDENWF